MATGWIAWTCLLLAGTSGVANDVAPYNTRRLQIPISLRPERRGEVSKLLLWTSHDQGKTWQRCATETPDKHAFDFTAKEDGSYWFSIATVNQSGISDPGDIETAPVGLKILIDTLKPDVRITSAVRDGDQVAVRWSVVDAYPDWNSLRLEYRAGNSPTAPWVPLPIKPEPQGSFKFRPSTPGDVALRLSIKDVADNQGVDERLVRADAVQLGPAIVDRAVVPAGAAATFRPAEGGTAPPPPSPTPGSSISQPLAVSSPAHSMAAKPPAPPSARESPALPVSTGSGENSLSTTTPMPPRLGAIPPLKIINKKQVKLDFDVLKYGPSDLGSVEVYVTTDEGANWARSEGAPEVSLPVSGEVRNSGPVRGSVTVQLPRDGIVYGFYLVIKSRAGLGKPAPAPGTAPQVRVEVDSTIPKVQLFRPKADASGGNSLVLLWTAVDKNLDNLPVSLEWAATSTGPWEFIGDPQLPNTGRYPWQITGNVPAKVFLRLTVRDSAGNVAVAQTKESVLIDLTTPEIGNVGFSAP